MNSKDGKCGGLVGSDPSTEQGKRWLRERGKAGGLWARALHTGQGNPVDRALPQTSTWRPHGANQPLLASQD